jgi:hypothetical protein
MLWPRPLPRTKGSSPADHRSPVTRFSFPLSPFNFRCFSALLRDFSSWAAQVQSYGSVRPWQAATIISPRFRSLEMLRPTAPQPREIARPGEAFTNLISLVRFATGQQADLAPFPEQGGDASRTGCNSGKSPPPNPSPPSNAPSSPSSPRKSAPTPRWKPKTSTTGR